MQRIKVLNVLCVCLLALGFHGTSVVAGQDSTFLMPFTLKDAVDLIGKISESSFKSEFAGAVDQKVQLYLKASGALGKGVEKSLEELFETIPELRKKLLKEPKDFGKYSELKESDIEESVRALITWLPVLHSELYYLYFQTGTHCVHIGGYKWFAQQLTQSQDASQLHQWLLSKGFKADELLEECFGFHLASLTGISIIGGPLSHAQYGLMLATPIWHHSNLASAVLFLEEFCDEVTKEDGVFKNEISDAEHRRVKSACSSIVRSIRALTDDLHPLYDGSIGMYMDSLKGEMYEVYFEWVMGNISGIIASLGQMVSESLRWTQSSLQSAQTSGPFKYGFVFKDAKWVGEPKTEL